MNFNHNDKTILYGQMLFNKEQEFLIGIFNLIDSVKASEDGFFGRKRALVRILDEYLLVVIDFDEYRKETRCFFQSCLSSHSNIYHLIQSLIDELHKILEEIDRANQVCFELIDRKISNIVSVHITVTNIVISFVAIGPSLIAIILG